MTAQVDTLRIAAETGNVLQHPRRSIGNLPGHLLPGCVRIERVVRDDNHHLLGQELHCHGRKEFLVVGVPSAAVDKDKDRIAAAVSLPVDIERDVGALGERDVGVQVLVGAAEPHAGTVGAEEVAVEGNLTEERTAGNGRNQQQERGGPEKPVGVGSLVLHCGEDSHFWQVRVASLDPAYRSCRPGSR